MNASAVADTPPVISSMTPRSHVMRATTKWMKRNSALAIRRTLFEVNVLNIDATRMDVVKRTCRF